MLGERVSDMANPSRRRRPSRNLTRQGVAAGMTIALYNITFNSVSNSAALILHVNDQ